ncbi:MAG: hypothetical protein P8J18_03455 [Halieaceae bacterium]|nr:hypothetical protein [Halieaceae bacterium]
MNKTFKFKSIIWITATFLVTASSQDLSKERLMFISSMFTGVEQHQNLNRAYKIFPTSKLPASKEPFTFGVVKSVNLPSSFIFRDKSIDELDLN